MKPLKQLLFGLLMLLLILPSVQQEFTFFNESPLRGAFIAMEKPGFTNWRWNSWLSGEFQEEFNNRIEHHIGFRNTLVRVNNQLQYSLFRKANAEGVIVGQEGELFEEDYIRAFYGEFFIGENEWDKKVERLKRIQDTLSQQGITFAVVFNPGKGSFHPDLFPAKYRNRSISTSNYNFFRNRLAETGVNVLDLNNYFLHIKSEAKHPIFPRIGTHWSYYGAALAADTLLGYLRHMHGPNIPELTIVNAVAKPEPRHPDDDIWLAMNLIRKPPVGGLVYPQLAFSQEKMDGRYKLLSIGDSFYFNWLSDSVMYYGFEEADFWYYNRFVWDKHGAQTGTTADIEVIQEVLSNDIILIMITERFHHNFAWGFDLQLYEHFFPGNLPQIEYFVDRVRINNEHFLRLVTEAKQKNMPLEHRIRREAEFLMYEDYQINPGKYTSREDRISILMMSMRGTPEWYAAIEEKAMNAGVPVDEMLRKDAEWVIDNP